MAGLDVYVGTLARVPEDVRTTCMKRPNGKKNRSSKRYTTIMPPHVINATTSQHRPHQFDLNPAGTTIHLPFQCYDVTMKHSYGKRPIIGIASKADHHQHWDPT